MQVTSHPWNRMNPTSRRSRSACNVSRGLSSLRFKGSKVSADLPKFRGNRWRTICKLLTDCFFPTNKCLYALNILNSRHNGMNLNGKEVQFSLGTTMLLVSPEARIIPSIETRSHLLRMTLSSGWSTFRVDETPWTFLSQSPEASANKQKYESWTQSSV